VGASRATGAADQALPAAFPAVAAGVGL